MMPTWWLTIIAIFEVQFNVSVLKDGDGMSDHTGGHWGLVDRVIVWHEVWKLVVGSYFTCAHINMPAVHPHKEGRYNQAVSQQQQEQMYFTVRAKWMQVYILIYEHTVLHKNASNSMRLGYEKGHLHPDPALCWCWEGVTEFSCQRLIPHRDRYSCYVSSGFHLSPVLMSQSPLP